MKKQFHIKHRLTGIKKRYNLYWKQIRRCIVIILGAKMNIYYTETRAEIRNAFQSISRKFRLN